MFYQIFVFGVKKNVLFFKSKESFSVTLCTIAFAAILGTFFSCAKEELDYSKLNLIGDPKPITVNATLPKSASLDKTTLSADGKVCWESDDKITVNGTELGISEILSDGALAVFEGKVGDITTTYGSGYWATYPTSLNASDYTASSVDVTLPATQTYSGDNIPNYMAAFSTANGSNLSLSFKNLCCIIKFQVKSNDNSIEPENKLSKIEIHSDQNIAGTATVSWNSGTPSMNFSAGSKTVTLQCNNTQLNNGTGVEFKLMIPAGTQNLTVKFYDATNKYMRKTVSGAALARSCIYNLSSTLNATETDYVFSVSDSTKVKFSPGNLQWTSTGSHAVAGGGTALGTWRFAEHQWDYVGDNRAGFGTVYEGDVKCDNAQISSSYTGWIDLFGWGTSGYNNKYPYMTSTDPTQYGNGSTGDIAGTNYDWGKYNQIESYPAGTWRTLTKDEIVYMLGTTTGRGNDNPTWWIFSLVKIIKADGTNDVKGAIIYPDGVTAKPSGVTADLRKDNSTTIVNISKADFDILEAAGCAFLPATGWRIDGTTIKNASNFGTYWSSTHSGTSYAYDYYFSFFSGTASPVNPANVNTRDEGRPVRLVKDVVE